MLPRIAVPGGSVEYDDVPGDPGRAPLLFLHEGLGSVDLWRGFHRSVAASTGRRAVAYSRLGHGRSDPPARRRTAAFLHEEAEVVVPAVRAALRLDAPVLVGHSDGGSIALIHAADRPVTALVLLAPHVFVEEIGLRGIEATRDAYLTGDLPARMARWHRDPDVTFWNWNDVWLSPEFRGWDVRAALPRIGAPTLAVQGTDDPYGTVAHVEAVRDAAAGPVDVLVLDCAHAPHLERPEAVGAAVTAFLRDVP